MPSLNRLHIDAELISNSSLKIEKEEFHYINNVLRANKILVFNAKDGEFEAAIEGKNQLTIGHKIRNPIVLPTKRLAFGVIRQSRLSWLLEKACELGVSEIYPLICKHSQYSDFKHDRYMRVLKEAAEQSGRFDLPKLYPLQKFDDFIEELNNHWCYGAIGSEEKKIASEVNGIVIGPEGGFNEQEERALRQKCFSLNMGPLILRAETAVIYGLCQLSMK